MTVNQILDDLRTQVKRDNGLGMFSGGFCTTDIELSNISTERYHKIVVKYGVQNDVQNDVHEETYFMNKETLSLLKFTTKTSLKRHKDWMEE